MNSYRSRSRKPRSRKPRSHKPRSPLNRRSRGSPTRGSPTRGWSPSKRITDRRKQKSRCGSKCFLLPSETKFPICDSDCTVSCKGVVSAYVRAKQWKYPTVAKKAKSYINKYTCTKKSYDRKK